nr:major capsid protein [Cupriavidus nantongensis]
MQVFNKYIMPAIIETLAQMVDKFNQASNGAIRLTTEGFEGDFLQESFFAAIHSAQRRVDRYAANGNAAPTDLTQLKHSSVKVAGGFGPIRFEPSQLTWLNKPTAEGIEVASRNFAEAMLADQLNTAIMALVAAISNNVDAVNDVSAANGISYVAMNEAHGKFGDHSGNLVAQIMNGVTFHKLIGANLANAQHLFQAQNVRVVDILGKPVVVTDSPALSTPAVVGPPAVPAKLRVLSLAEGAATVSDGSDVISNIETSNGKERIETTMQVDYTFGLGLKGYTWDEANGGKSPTDAKLATGANWDQTASSIKHTAGVITIGDASK